MTPQQLSFIEIVITLVDFQHYVPEAFEDTMHTSVIGG
jgi:hypothetical protein